MHQTGFSLQNRFMVFFNGFKALYNKPFLYFPVKGFIFLVIILERLYMLLKGNSSDLAVYFIPLIFVLLISILSEYFLLKLLIRRKVRETMILTTLFIHQIITFQALIELTLPMLQDLIYQQERDVLKTDILFLTVLVSTFVNSTILRLGIFSYVIAVEFFRLSNITTAVYFIGWGLMMGSLLVTGIIIYIRKYSSQEGHFSEKIKQELSSYTKGLAVLDREGKIVFMNGNFKGILGISNENEALEEVLKLKRFESLSEKAQRTYLDEIINDKSPSLGLKRKPSLKKAENGTKPFGRMSSLRKSFDNDKQSVVTFKDSIDIYKFNAPRDSNDRSSDINLMNPDEQPLTSMLTKTSIKKPFWKGRARKDNFPARQANKPDTEQDLIPHEESVEAMMENLFNTTYQARTNKLNDSAKKYITLLKDDDYSKNGIMKQAEEKNEEVNAQKARVVHRAQNGKLHVLEVKCFPFSDSSNEGIFLNVVDITQDIKLQEALDMSEQKDRLLRFVSHEFRTPLNCALALLGGLKSKISYSLSTEYLNPALNSCKLLLSLVNDLLDFSMIKEKKLKIFIQPCNLKKVFEEVIDLMESQATIQNLELNLVWDPEISRIFYTDQTRVQQILLNLISNALKFTRQGSITVKVARIDTSIVRVEVRDTGVGISAKSLDNLFKEFSKLKENTHLNPQGIGLGLVISKLLSIELGPDNVGLTVEPEQEGTTFSFLLQAKTDDVMKGDYLNRTGEIDVSDDESRNKPAGLLNYMSRNFRTIEQATKPPAPLMSAIQEDTLRSANSNDINPEGYVKMNSKLLEFQAKLEVQTKGRVNRLGTVVKSNIIISTNNLLTDPIKVSAYSNERNVFKKKTMKNHLKRTKPKERAQSWGRSQTVALGDADFGASMIIWEFSILVHSLNTRCQCPKVLLVDDNAYNLLALTHQLRSLDLDSVSATDGEVAIQKVLNHQNHHPKCKNFSIIFMDVEMPRLNGFEATRQLRKKMLEGEISFIPIIGLSGHNPKEMRKECLLSGMNDMIIKPATPKMLQETILKWVEEAD